MTPDTLATVAGWLGFWASCAALAHVPAALRRARAHRTPAPRDTPGPT